MGFQKLAYNKLINKIEAFEKPSIGSYTNVVMDDISSFFGKD